MIFYLSYNFKDLKYNYYVGRIQDKLSFVLIFESNYKENKAKAAAFVQEVCFELNFNRIFQAFNANLK